MQDNITAAPPHAKVKAREILVRWPAPHSTSRPLPPAPISDRTTLGLQQLIDFHRVLDDRDEERLYHDKQALGLARFMSTPDCMETLYLSIQLQTQRRRMQLILKTEDGEILVIGEMRAYPHGVDLINHNICGIAATSPAACMFCLFGHMDGVSLPAHLRRCAMLTRLEGPPMNIDGPLTYVNDLLIEQFRLPPWPRSHSTSRPVRRRYKFNVRYNAAEVYTAVCMDELHDNYHRHQDEMLNNFLADRTAFELLQASIIANLKCIKEDPLFGRFCSCRECWPLTVGPIKIGARIVDLYHPLAL